MVHKIHPFYLNVYITKKNPLVHILRACHCVKAFALGINMPTNDNKQQKQKPLAMTERLSSALPIPTEKCLVFSMFYSFFSVFPGSVGNISGGVMACCWAARFFRPAQRRAAPRCAARGTGKGGGPGVRPAQVGPGGQRWGLTRCLSLFWQQRMNQIWNVQKITS